MLLPSKKLLTKLLVESGGEIDKAYEKLETYVSIQNELERVHAAINQEQERHEKALAKLENSLVDIRRHCDHPDTTRHYDPSGGSDSFDSCNICGMEQKQITKRGLPRP